MKNQTQTRGPQFHPVLPKFIAAPVYAAFRDVCARFLPRTAAEGLVLMAVWFYLTPRVPRLREQRRASQTRGKANRAGKLPRFTF